MKISNKKIYISGVIVVILVLILILFLLQEISKSSQALILQKKDLISFEQRRKNLENFREKYKTHQQNLEKINNFFVDSTLPIEFMDFLEKFILNSQSSIKISLTKEITEPEPALSFNILFSGSFSNLLELIDKLENSPYLIEITNLNVRKIAQESPDNITANLELIVLVK